MALGGLLGPILFTITIIICGSWRVDYSHLHNFISELGATNTSNYQLMNFLGFIPSGIFLCLFGISLLIITPKSFKSKIGSALIIIFGIGVMLAGIFSCDQGCPPIGSLESTVHDRVSAIAFMSAIAGISLLGLTFRKLTSFKNLSTYSILSGIIAALFLITMISTFESRVYTGLWQRLLLLTIFIWTSIMGLFLNQNFDELKLSS